MTADAPKYCVWWIEGSCAGDAVMLLREAVFDKNITK